MHPSASSTIPLPQPPPFSNYGILTGQLFLYQQGQAAFESPPPQPPRSQAQAQAPSSSNESDLSSLFRPNKLIVIGGLSDGLLPVPYLQELYDEICGGGGGGGRNDDDGGGDTSWSIVQPTMRSSYTGFGHGSLARDCDDLCKLLVYLSTYRGAQRFALLGHSTGCQDLVYFWKHAHGGIPVDVKSKIRLLILQAPVSDREGVEDSDKDLPSKIQYAQSLVDTGKGDEMVPRSYFWTPMTAQRFLDLHQRNGKDDFFSSDLSDDELNDRLSHISDGIRYHTSSNTDDEKDTATTDSDHQFKVLVAYSGEDEYVPSHVNKQLLTERLVNAMNANSYSTRVKTKKEDPQTNLVAHGLNLPTGNHNLSKNPDDVKLFISKVSEMIQNISSSSN